MVNIAKQIAHWRNGAKEDWDVACLLVSQGRIRHGLFFAHLAVEKVLKAHFCKSRDELAPPIHNLLRLAEKTGLSLKPSQIDLFTEVNSFNIEGRYPELFLPLPSQYEAEEFLQKIGELMECLNKLF